MNLKKRSSKKSDGFGEQYFALLSKVMDLSPALQMQFILIESFFKSDNQINALSKKRISKTLQNFMIKLEQNSSMSNIELRYLVQVQLNNRQVQKIKILKSVFEFFDKVILKSEHISSNQNINEEQSVTNQVVLNS